MKRTRRRRLGAGILASLYLSASVAHAQSPAPSAAASDTKPASAVVPNAKAPDSTASDADVIRLKNGGLVRGNISELIPGDSVTIVTITGKTREFPMSEVDYAGPVDADPQRQPAAASPVAPPAEAVPKAAEDSSKDEKVKPYVTVHAEEARLKLMSDDSGITYYRQAATASGYAVGISSQSTSYAFGYATGYERICTAPCEASLPAGSEVLALGRDDKPPIPADAVTLPAGDSELHGTIESRTGLRVALIVLGVATAVGGVALALTANGKKRECDEYGDCYDRDTLKLPQFIGGIALGSVGSGLTFAPLFIRDKAVVEVRPQSDAAQPRSTVARGLALSGQF